ncbi:MAG: hypothetical protein ACP5OO_04945 [Chloroflexia bacterium]
MMMFWGWGMWFMWLFFLALLSLPILVALLVLWLSDRAREKASQHDR